MIEAHRSRLARFLAGAGALCLTLALAACATPPASHGGGRTPAAAESLPPVPAGTRAFGTSYAVAEVRSQDSAGPPVEPARRKVPLYLRVSGGLAGLTGDSAHGGLAIPVAGGLGLRFPGGLGLEGGYQYHRTAMDGERATTRDTWQQSCPPPEDPEQLPECQDVRVRIADVIDDDDHVDFHILGLKVTYEQPLLASHPELTVHGGVGPDVFWLRGFRESDQGVGIGAEAGLGLRLSDQLGLRLGFDGHALPTDLGNAGDERWLVQLGGLLDLIWDF